VDLGNIHNFMSGIITKRVGLKPMLGEKFDVMVAFGKKIS
jgi:hypothetical protein